MIRDRADASLIQVVPARYGRMMVMTNDLYMGAAFLRFGEYSESEVELWRQLVPKNAIVADVGANIGAHTVALANLVTDGFVVAFEPVPFLYQMLAGNLALNGLTNAKAMQVAVSDQPCSLLVPAIDYTNRDNYGGLALLDHMQGNRTPKVKLDDVLPVCHFLKADVEGMERYVLRGASRIIRECRPMLYLENNPGPNQQDLINDVHALGYDCWWHLAPLYNPKNINGAACDDSILNVASFNMLCLPSETAHNITGLEPIARVSHNAPAPLANS